MSQELDTAIAVIGIDIGKNSFHVVGLDDRGAIVLRQKRSRGQVDTRLANLPPRLYRHVGLRWPAPDNRSASESCRSPPDDQAENGP